MDKEFISFVLAAAFGTALGEMFETYVENHVHTYNLAYNDDNEYTTRSMTMKEHINIVKNILREDKIYHNVSVNLQITKNPKIDNNQNSFLRCNPKLNKMIYESGKIINKVNCDLKLSKASELDNLLDVIFYNDWYDYSIILNSVVFNIGVDSNDIILSYDQHNVNSMIINKDNNVYTKLVKYGYENKLINHN